MPDPGDSARGFAQQISLPLQPRTLATTIASQRDAVVAAVEVELWIALFDGGVDVAVAADDRRAVAVAAGAVARGIAGLADLDDAVAAAECAGGGGAAFRTV